MWEFYVALIRAGCSRDDHKRSRHSMCGSVVVTFRGPQRRRAGGVPGGVYERSGLLVCVCLFLVNVASARVLRDAGRRRVLSSSSLDASHCVELCVAHWYRSGTALLGALLLTSWKQALIMVTAGPVVSRRARSVAGLWRPTSLRILSVDESSSAARDQAASASTAVVLTSPL